MTQNGTELTSTMGKQRVPGGRPDRSQCGPPPSSGGGGGGSHEGAVSLPVGTSGFTHLGVLCGGVPPELWLSGLPRKVRWREELVQVWG